MKQIVLIVCSGLFMGIAGLQTTLAAGFIADRILEGNSELIASAYVTTPVNKQSESEITGWKLYKDWNNPSVRYFNQPSGIWLNGTQNDKEIVSRAISVSTEAVPVFVLYFSPTRNNKYPTEFHIKDYLNRNREIAQFIKTNQAIIIVEPDALCLNSDSIVAQEVTQEIIRNIVTIYRQECPNARIYIDAGHSQWVPVYKMARILRKSGIEQADGFSTNVSNFQYTENEIAYAQKLSGLLAGKRFVIDTSRNGNGPGQKRLNGPLWSDPTNIKTGLKPTTVTAHKMLDAFLWVKPPGEADGTAFPAGSWHPELIIKP